MLWLTGVKRFGPRNKAKTDPYKYQGSSLQNYLIC